MSDCSGKNWRERWRCSVCLNRSTESVRESESADCICKQQDDEPRWRKAEVLALGKGSIHESKFMLMVEWSC